jgi:hypothetical protein
MKQDRTRRDLQSNTMLSGFASSLCHSMGSISLPISAEGAVTTHKSVGISYIKRSHYHGSTIHDRTGQDRTG